jgi:integrase
MSPDITLADAITALVAEKRAVGYKYAGEERVLARFAAFCRSQFPGLGAPTQASVEAWLAAARRRGVQPATLQTLAAPVRELARWLGRRGVPAYVLPAGALPRPARYVPHIYTDQELAALFAQTDRCRYCAEVPLRHLIMPVLFRTIYACGLRASEARLLRAGDVDTSAGVLQIRDAKGGKDRQVPVSAPLRERLADYHARVPGRPGGDWFFPGTSGPGHPATRTDELVPLAHTTVPTRITARQARQSPLLDTAPRCRNPQAIPGCRAPDRRAELIGAAPLR